MARRFVWMGGLTAAVALGCLVWTFVAAQPPQPASRHKPDLVYAKHGGETLQLDLVMPPEGEGPFPAVLCIHGGGWTSGSRKHVPQTIEALARRGYVAAAVDYRLAPKHPFPACIEDCKAAVRWLRVNAAAYRIDPERIGVVGLSAGGHLACLLGVTGPDDGLEGAGDHKEVPSKVQAVVSLAGPTDLTDEKMWTPQVMALNLMPLFGGPPRTLVEAYRKASPARYTPRNPPPFLLVHGSADTIVPVRQAHLLAERLKKAGGRVKVLELENEPHTWKGRSLVTSINEMLNFLDETLKK